MDHKEYCPVLRRQKTGMNELNFWTACFVFSCYVLLIVIVPSKVVAQTVQEIAKRGFSSTVLLVMQDSKGQNVSLGTGFFVRDGEIASNVHVVEGASRGYAKLVNDKNKYEI